MKTTVRLGKSKAYIVKTKSKFKPERTGYCNSPTCLSVVQLDDHNQCLRCFNKVVQKQNFDTICKWFDMFIRKNEKLFCSERFPENITISVPIHKRTYFVPIRYFFEYDNIKHTDDFAESKEMAYFNFFNHIKDTCFSIVL